MTSLYELDCELFRAIHSALFGTPAETVLYFVQFAGSAGIVLLILIALAFTPRGRRLDVTLRIIASVLVASACCWGLKHLVQAPRPASHVPQHLAAGFWAMTDSATYAQHGNSWPSGHSTAVFAYAAAVLVLRLPKKLVVFAFVIAFLTALGRVALGSHFPSDVIAGALVGSTAGGLTAGLRAPISGAPAAPVVEPTAPVTEPTAPIA